MYSFEKKRIILKRKRFDLGTRGVLKLEESEFF